MSLFNDEPAPVDPKTVPLAERMRPQSLDEIVGQDDLVAPGRPLREMIDRDLLQSIILWGPPGTGKTTLARLIADLTKAEFIAFSAVLAGIKEVKDVMSTAEQRRRMTGKRTIVFVDEIHRFNKAQQDAFLPRVESGDIVLIGATTENPSFEVNAALLSRSKVFVLKALGRGRADRDPAQGADRCRARPRPRAAGSGRRCAAGDCAVCERRCAVGAEPAAADGVVGAEPDRPAAHRPGAARQGAHQQDAALRQERRRALQPDVGAAQVDAQQRRGCVDLLAGAHAGGRRGSEIRRAAADSLRVGRHRQRRSAGAGHDRGRQGRGAFHRHARGQHRARAGRALSRDGAEEQCRLHGLQRGRRSREDRLRRAGAAAHPQRADQVDEAARLRQGLPVRARRARRRREHGLPARQPEGAGVLQTDRLRIREGNHQAAGVVEEPRRQK